MSANTVENSSKLAQDTSRGPSPSLWNDAPVLDIIENPGLGMYFFDDFLVAGNLATTNAIGNMGQWATWADTSTVLGTDPQQEGGVILLSDAGNITKNVTLGSTAGSFRLVSAATANPLAQGKLWFEARVAVGSITTTKRDAFVGLVDNTTQFSTASATAVINTGNVLATGPALLGFHFRSSTNPTDVGVAFNAAGGTVQYPTGLQTLSTTVAGAALTAYAAGAAGALGTGFIKLGFLFDPGAPSKTVASASSSQTAGTLRQPSLTFFVNGQICNVFLSTADNLSATTFPLTWMGPVLSYTSRAASASGGLYVDWIRVCQLGVA